MSIFLLVILLGLTVLFGLLFWFGEGNGNGNGKGTKYVGSLVCSILFVSGTTWAIISHNQPNEIEKEYTTEIKTVVYPDGSSKQMFMWNHTPCSVTERWQKIVDEKEWVVQITEPKTSYFGLSYGGKEFNTRITLVKKPN